MSYIDNLEIENDTLIKELAELRQAINKLPSRNSTALVSEIYNAIELAKRDAKRAKEQDSE